MRRIVFVDVNELCFRHSAELLSFLKEFSLVLATNSLHHLHLPTLFLKEYNGLHFYTNSDFFFFSFCRYIGL